MASNDAPTSLEIDDVKTGDPIVKTEVIIDDGPSTSYSEIVTKEDGNQMDVDNNDDPIDILNDLCKLKIKVETTPDGITELSVDSPDFDRSGEDVMMSSEQVRRYLDFKIREYLKDSQVNKLMRLFKRSLELKEILKEKNEEYLKIQKLMDMIFRNQEKFLRQAGILPKIPMYSRGISVDLPFLPPSESLKLPKLYLDSNAAQSKPVSTTTTTKPTPTPSPVPNHPSNSSANKEKERIECIDLTDDQDSSDKSPKGSASSSGESHPAPLPPRPFVTPNDRYLKIPPRPRLKVKGDAQGIILQWDMPPAYNIKIHAAVTAYEIFGYQVVPKHTVCTLLWKKIGTVKAMTLPMACTLTQFQEGNKYFFAIRAMDGHNRCSHFSEALSIVYNSRHKGDKGSK